MSVEGRRAGLVCLLLVASLVAPLSCGRRGATTPEDAPSGGARHETALVPDAVLRAVCAHAPCGGASALVRVYRRPDHTIGKLYRLYGACVHSPGLYFESDGTLADTIPERPIAPDSPEAAELRLRHEKQVGGMTATDALRCSDGARVPP